MPTARATLSPPRGHPKCELFGFHIVSLIVTDKKKNVRPFDGGLPSNSSVYFAR